MKFKAAILVAFWVAAWAQVGFGAAPITSGQTVFGSITVGNPTNTYTFDLAANDSAVVALAKTTGTATLYPHLRIYSPSGSLLASEVGSSVAERFFQASQSGTYTAVVLDGGVYGTGTGDYQLSLSGTITASSNLRIVRPPANQVVNAGATVQFTVAASGAEPLYYQWQFNGTAITGAASGTLTLANVQPGKAGRYSVRVSNAMGSVTSQTATLALLADPANGAPREPVQIPVAPPKPTGEANLIVITHGWQIPFLPLDVSWVDDMANTIQQKLTSQGLNNWQVLPVKWGVAALMPYPDLALINATIIGTGLGKTIGATPWNHVHLIGHSAGAGLIQAASEMIKLGSPNTTVHTTFLDPYVGVLGVNIGLYGQGANWSDTYFARDVSGTFTRDVPNSHNVDVTVLDTDHSFFEIRHSWPYKFYSQSVTNGFVTLQGDRSQGYGFQRSLEGGGWASRGNYPVGQVKSLSGLPAYELPTILPSNTRTEINLTKFSLTGNSYAVSTPSTAQIYGGLFQFTSGGSLAPQSVKRSPESSDSRVAQGLVPASGPVLEPAWVSLGVTVTNLANYVKFDATFMSASGAQGLLTVYWGTNLIGTVDERVATTGAQTYRFLLPEAYTDGQYTLGFRLDAYTTTPSSLTLTNVFTGFLGITNPPALTVAASTTNGPAQVTLTGATGYYSILQSSTDLTNWTPIAALVNSNGVVQFTDPGSTNQARRYYRAVVP